MRSSAGSPGSRQPDKGREARLGRAALSRRVLTAIALAAAVASGFAVYLRLAQTRAVNSDGAAQALQAWDMLHGNLLLHHWTTSDVSFYTTEVPESVPGPSW